MLGFHKKLDGLKSEGVKYIEQKYGVTPKPVEQPTNKLYSIYDIAEGKFKPPFVAPSDLSARRCISEAVAQDKRSMLYKYSNDYNLCCLGTFDDINGIVDSQNVTIICNVSELIEKENTVDLPKFVEQDN